MRAVAALIALGFLGLAAAAAWEVKFVLLHNPHFSLVSVMDIPVSGNRVVTTSQALRPFAGDVGRSVFRVPLEKRQAQLQTIRWVRRASVMRIWPNRLRVNVVERTPVAFVLDGDTIRLVDEQGVLLDLPDAAARHYSFPVLAGISSSDPLSTRAARVATYLQFARSLDRDGDRLSTKLSEVDLTDPEDVRATFTGGTRQPLVHFGDRDFLPRYRAYQAHLTEWLQQYPQLRSVDMRYGRQIVLDTGATAGSAQPLAAAPPAAPRAVADATPSHTVAKSKTISRRSKTRTVAPKISAGRRSMRNAAKSRHAAGRKHTPMHRHTAPAGPERGHPVPDPIMHVVSGT